MSTRSGRSSLVCATRDERRAIVGRDREEPIALPVKQGGNSRTARRRSALGMRTWVMGILRVVAVLTGCVLVLGIVSVFVFQHGHRVSLEHNAETDARIVRLAIQQWQAAHDERTCPTIEQLRQEQQLDPGQPPFDAWHRPFRLRCTGGEVTVRSAGRDQQFDTADDILVPKGAR